MIAGTCFFCGVGGGYLGEQGDEMTTTLHSAVRSGEPGAWKYDTPEGAERAGTVTWCGFCLRGLAHKFQRYDDANLRAALLAGNVRLSLDAPRWVFWEVDDDERAKLIESGLHPDDYALHSEKLRLRRDVDDMQQEVFRRAGVNLVGRDRGWRE